MDIFSRAIGTQKFNDKNLFAAHSLSSQRPSNTNVISEKASWGLPAVLTLLPLR